MSWLFGGHARFYELYILILQKATVGLYGSCVLLHDPVVTATYTVSNVRQ